MPSTPTKRASYVVQHFDAVFSRADIEARPRIAERPWFVVQDGVRPLYAATSRENMGQLAVLLSGARDLPGETQQHRWGRPQGSRLLRTCSGCRAERAIVSWPSVRGLRDVLCAFVGYQTTARGWNLEEPPCSRPRRRKIG